MVDVCDVPVISGVCDVAGDAAGTLVSAPFDWLAQGMGQAAGWMFEAVWKVIRLDHDGRCHQQPVHEGLQHPLRRRRLRHARLLHAPSHRRHDPARTRRAVSCGTRVGEVDPRVVRRPCAPRHRSGGRRPALHRHRSRSGHQYGADGRPDRPARRRTSDAQHRSAGCWRDHHDLHRRPRYRRGRDRVDQPAHPQGAPAHRHRLRTHRPCRVELGPHPTTG